MLSRTLRTHPNCIPTSCGEAYFSKMTIRLWSLKIHLLGKTGQAGICGWALESDWQPWGDHGAGEKLYSVVGFSQCPLRNLWVGSGKKTWSLSHLWSWKSNKACWFKTWILLGSSSYSYSLAWAQSDISLLSQASPGPPSNLCMKKPPTSIFLFNVSFWSQPTNYEAGMKKGSDLK